ncbi:MAG: hypothetical protein Q7R96_01110, partial [Nanoarchaeota archaeon]|nr:hypothetical protein [Nanoarchaeota archaeon]
MLLRTTAASQIFILIFAIIALGYFAAPVTATPPQQVCCEKTISGNSCQYTTTDQCDPQYKTAATNCQETPFCITACCYLPEQGTCSNNVPAGTCTSNGGQSFPNPACINQQCQLGCCAIGNNYQLTTEQQCRYISNNYPGLAGEDNYDETIQNEQLCLDQAHNQDEGCCITEQGTCQYTTKNTCSTEGTSNGGPGFYTNTYCSSPTLNCRTCIAHAQQKCSDNAAYWYDSCGNKEEQIERCSNEQVCTTTGTTASCKSNNCETTQAYAGNPHDEKIGTGGFRRNGESWCVYESPTGDFRDYPGSRHYQHYCYQGQEYVEPCREFREEVCIQGGVTLQDSYEESNAQCIPNAHKGENGYKEKGNITTVPLGQAFWPNKDEERTPEEDAKKICKKANVKCKAYYIKEDHFSDWECAANCECEEQAWIDQAGTYCKAQGDCGLDYNILQVPNTKGFRIRYDMKVAGKSGIGTHSGIFELQKGYFEGGTTTKIVKTPLSMSYWRKMHTYGVFGGMQQSAVSYSKVLKAYYTNHLEQTETYDKPGGRRDPLGYAYTGSVRGVIESIPIVTVVFAVFRLIFGKIFENILDIIFGTKTAVNTITTTCRPYTPPTGGNNCNQCGKDQLHICTEYQCKSLGTSCSYINGDTDKPLCIDDNPNDANAPIITAWPAGITPGYTPAATATGYLLQPIIPPYQPITLGILTDEPAQCTWSTQHVANMEDMENSIDDYYQLEHNFTIRAPPGTTSNYYLRCEDTHGNYNLAEYEITVQVNPEPDLTPPSIIETSILNNGYLPYNTNRTAFSLMTNEPASCKWNKEDVDYINMPYNFICNNNTLTEESLCDTILFN